MKLQAINENHLFVKSYSRGKRYVCTNISIYVLRDFHAEKLRRANPSKVYVNRVGIAVGKKIGGAVARNRAKRIIRAAYRAVDKKYKIKTGFLIVLAARENITSPASREKNAPLQKTAPKKSGVVKTADIERDLKYGLTKLGMLENIRA